MSMPVGVKRKIVEDVPASDLFISYGSPGLHSRGDKPLRESDAIPISAAGRRFL